MLDNLIKLSNTNIVMLCERCGQEIHQKQQANRQGPPMDPRQDRPGPPQMDPRQDRHGPHPVDRPLPPHMDPHQGRPVPPQMDPRYAPYDYPEMYDDQDPNDVYQHPRQYYGSQYRVPQRRYQPRRFISNEQARHRF